MKIGVEDRRRVAVACALSVLALLTLGRWIFGSESLASASSASNAITTVQVPTAPPARKTKANRTDSLDPTLQFARLELTEHEMYDGTGRNIFRSYEEDQPEKSRPAPKPQPTPPAVIQATAETPAIRLKFFGIATSSDSRRKACLTQDGDVFIGAEGDVVDRHYKILRIGPNTVDIEDLLDNKQYTLLLPH